MTERHKQRKYSIAPAKHADAEQRLIRVHAFEPYLCPEGCACAGGIRWVHVSQQHRHACLLHSELCVCKAARDPQVRLDHRVESLLQQRHGRLTLVECEAVDARVGQPEQRVLDVEQ
eukprot:247865-Prymnesium_polylepis.2